VHLVDFIIRIYHDARSPERQICVRQSSYIQSPSIEEHNGDALPENCAPLVWTKCRVI